VAHTLKYCPKNKDGLEDVLSINTLKSMRSSTGIRRNLQAGNSSVTSYPPPQYQVSRIHGRRQVPGIDFLSIFMFVLFLRVEQKCYRNKLVVLG
jgi:hypothetical protein